MNPRFRTKNFLEKQTAKHPGLFQIRASTKVPLSHSLRVLREIESARGFHPEMNIQTRPTIGAEAEKDYFDPVSKDRWSPQFREAREIQKTRRINAKRKIGPNNADIEDSPDGEEEEPQGPQGPPDLGNGANATPAQQNGEQPVQDPNDPNAQVDPNAAAGDPSAGMIRRKELPDEPQKDPRKEPTDTPRSDLPTADAKIVRRYSMTDDPLTQGISTGGGAQPTNAKQVRDAIKRARGNRGAMNTKKGPQPHGPTQKYWN